MLVVAVCQVVPRLMSHLFPFLPFDPVETPLSFAARLATFHTGGRLGPFVHDIGVKAGELAAGQARAVTRLCDLAGVDSAPVFRNTAQSVGRRRYDLRGETVSADFFAGPYTVFCPACLRADDAAHGAAGCRRGRLAWTLRPVRTCPRHDLQLTRRQHRSWDERFRELHVCVAERGDALDEMIAHAVRRPVSPLQAYVMRRLEGHAGPAWLDGQTLEQAVNATERLGALVAFGAKTEWRELTDADLDRAGREGFGFTADGEAGIRAALGRVQSRVATTGRAGGQKLFGHLYNWLSSSKVTKDPGDIRRIVREHMLETMEFETGATVLGEKLLQRRLHSVESLARESALDARTLRNVLVARGVIATGADVTQTSGAAVFDANAGREVADSVHRSTKVTKLPTVLNCTRPQVDQILDERLLVPLSIGPVGFRGRTQKAVADRAITDFLSALRARSRPVSAVPSGTVPISKAAEKARATSAAIFHLILGGFLESVVRLRDVDGCAALLVDPAEVRLKTAQHMTGLSAREAFAMLRVPRATLWALADRDVAPRLHPTVVEGATGHRFFRFHTEDIADLMGRFTTPVRIAEDRGIPKNNVNSRLKGAKVRPVLTRSEIGVDLYRVTDLPGDFVS